MNDRYESLQTPDLEKCAAAPLSPLCGDSISFSERDLIIDSCISALDTDFISASRNSPFHIDLIMSTNNQHAQSAQSAQHQLQQQSLQQSPSLSPHHLQHQPELSLPNVSSTSSLLSLQWIKKPINIQIEGNIGAGKTRLMYYLQHGSLVNKIDFIDEPIAKWIDCHGVNLLEQFYMHPSESNAASFHYYVMLTLLQNHLQPSSKPLKIMERSIHSCMLFLEIQHRNAAISDIDYNILKDYYATFCSLATKPDIVIYMDSSVLQCRHNIDVRNRPGETITTEYLEQVDVIHKQWIIDLIRYKQKVIVIHHVYDLADVEAFLIKYLNEGLTAAASKQLRNGCLYNFEVASDDAISTSPSSPKWIKCDSCKIIEQQLV